MKLASFNWGTAEEGERRWGGRRQQGVGVHASGSVYVYVYVYVCVVCLVVWVSVCYAQISKQVDYSTH